MVEQTQMAPHFAGVACSDKVDAFRNYFDLSTVPPKSVFGNSYYEGPRIPSRKAKTLLL